MAVITITTVGFREVHEPTSAGKAFVIGHLIVGIGVFYYGIVQIGEHILRAELGDWWEKRKMDRSIKTLTGHYVITSSAVAAGWGASSRAS